MCTRGRCKYPTMFSRLTDPASRCKHVDDIWDSHAGARSRVHPLHPQPPEGASPPEPLHQAAQQPLRDSRPPRGCEGDPCPNCLFVSSASATTPAARLAPPAQDCPSPIIAIPSAVAVGDVSCNLTFGTTLWNAVPAAGYEPSGADKAAEPCAPGTAKAGPGSFT